MTYFEIPQILALANLVLCAAIAWCCICRLHRMTAKSTRKDVRAAVSALMAGAFASGFSPVLFSEYPGPGHVMLALGILALLIVGARDWKKGLPPYARTAPAPLETTY